MNFKLSVENDPRPPQIIKGFALDSPMKDLQSKISEILQLPAAFEILTGYPPALLNYQLDDLVSATFTGASHWLMIRTEKSAASPSPAGEKGKTQLPAKRTPKSTAKPKQPKMAAKPNALSTSGENVSYFADRIRDDKKQPHARANAIHHRHELMDSHDASFECSSDDGDTGFVEARHSQRIGRQPRVNYVVLDRPPEPAHVPKKKAAKKEKGYSLMDPPLADEKPKKKKSAEDKPKKEKKEKKEKPVQRGEGAIGDTVPNLDFVVQVMAHQADPFNIEAAQDSMAEIMAACSGEGETKWTKMREAFRTGLEVEQETTKGLSRFQAMCASNYKMAKSNTIFPAGRAKLTIQFSHGINEIVEEKFDLYSRDELKAIFTFVILSQGEQGKEGLRPRNMSIVSPRTFWSMVYHFQSDLEGGLKKLLPRIDFSFLDYRVRAKSKLAHESEESERNYGIIERDYKKQKREIEHSKLQLNHDVIQLDEAEKAESIVVESEDDAIGAANNDNNSSNFSNAPNNNSWNTIESAAVCGDSELMDETKERIDELT